MRWNVNLSAISTTLRNLVCAVFSLGSLAGLSHADDRAAKLEILRRWTAEAAAIKTAKIKCLHAKLSPAAGTELARVPPEDGIEDSLTSEEFRVLFQEHLVPLAGRPKAREALERAVETCIAEAGRKLDALWSELEIVQDGENVRNDEVYSKTRNVRLVTPERFYSYESSLNAAMIGGRNSMFAHARTTRDLKFAPDSAPPDGVDQVQLIPSVADQEAKLVAPGAEIVFDSTTGFVKYLVASDAEAGGIFYENRQALPCEWTGDVVMPTISATVRYRKTRAGESRISNVDLFVIETAEFNQKIAPADLRVAVPKGTVIGATDILPELSEAKKPAGTVTAAEDIADLASVKSMAEIKAVRRQK